MVDQYLPTNINSPRRTITVAGTVSLSEDAALVIVNTVGLGAAPTITLPNARVVDGLTVTLKVPVATVVSGGQNVIVNGVGGQTIDGAASVTISVDETALTVKSDNANWRIVAQTNVASAGCCAPAVLAPGGIGGMAQGPAEVLTLSAGTCGLDEPMTGEAFNDPDVPSGAVPTVSGVVVNEGVAPAPNTIDVTMDTSLSDGGYILVLTNACGCCAVLRFSVAAA